MIELHMKSSSILLRPTEVQGLIQDLVYARKKSCFKDITPKGHR